MADHTYLGENSGLVTGSSPLEVLVRDLNEQAKAFAGYLRGNGLPEPSFERSAPIVNLSPQAPEEVRMAREKLLDNALQIFKLIAGPGEYLPHLVEGVSKGHRRILHLFYAISISVPTVIVDTWFSASTWKPSGG